MNWKELIITKIKQQILNTSVKKIITSILNYFFLCRLDYIILELLHFSYKQFTRKYQEDV